MKETNNSNKQQTNSSIVSNFPPNINPNENYPHISFLYFPLGHLINILEYHVSARIAFPLSTKISRLKRGLMHAHNRGNDD